MPFLWNRACEDGSLAPTNGSREGLGIPFWSGTLAEEEGELPNRREGPKLGRIGVEEEVATSQDGRYCTNIPCLQWPRRRHNTHGIGSWHSVLLSLASGLLGSVGLPSATMSGAGLR